MDRKRNYKVRVVCKVCIKSVWSEYTNAHLEKNSGDAQSFWKWVDRNQNKLSL